MRAKWATTLAGVTCLALVATPTDTSAGIITNLELLAGPESRETYVIGSYQPRVDARAAAMGGPRLGVSTLTDAGYGFYGLHTEALRARQTVIDWMTMNEHMAAGRTVFDIGPALGFPQSKFILDEYQWLADARYPLVVTERSTAQFTGSWGEDLADNRGILRTSRLTARIPAGEVGALAVDARPATRALDALDGLGSRRLTVTPFVPEDDWIFETRVGAALDPTDVRAGRTVTPPSTLGPSASAARRVMQEGVARPGLQLRGTGSAGRMLLWGGVAIDIASLGATITHRLSEPRATVFHSPEERAQAIELGRYLVAQGYSPKRCLDRHCDAPHLLISEEEFGIVVWEAIKDHQLAEERRAYERAHPPWVWPWDSRAKWWGPFDRDFWR